MPERRRAMKMRLCNADHCADKLRAGRIVAHEGGNAAAHVVSARKIQ